MTCGAHDSFSAILHAVGFGVDRVSLGAVAGALTELINDGQMEVQWRRGRRYFQATHNNQVGAVNRTP